MKKPRSFSKDSLTALPAVMLSTAFLLVIATYPQYFLYNPLQFGVNVLSILQICATIGWVGQVLVPPIVLFVFGRRKTISWTLLLASAVIWPLSVVSINIYLYATTGYNGFRYLINDPIFIFTDILTPLFYLFTFIRVKSSTRKTKRSSVQGEEHISLNV